MEQATTSVACAASDLLQTNTMAGRTDRAESIAPPDRGEDPK